MAGDVPDYKANEMTPGQRIDAVYDLAALSLYSCLEMIIELVKVNGDIAILRPMIDAVKEDSQFLADAANGPFESIQELQEFVAKIDEQEQRGDFLNLTDQTTSTTLSA